MSYHCESMSYQAVLSQAPADLYPPEIKIPSLHPPRLKMWVMLRMMLKRRMRSSRKRRVMRRQCLKCWHWRSALPANFGSSSLFKANTSPILASRFSSRNWKWFYNFISQPVQREYTCRRAIWIQCHSVLEFHRCSLWTPWWQHLMRLARRHGLIITSTTST